MKPTSVSMPAPTAATASKSLQEQAYILLKQMIESGRIQPGDRLQEAQVAKAFGISRSPARNALEALCQQKLIQEHGKRGYRISDRTPSKDTGQLAHLGSIKILRQILEPQALMQAAPHIPEELLIRVRNNIETTPSSTPIESLKFDQVEIDLHR